jgi:glycolate oxidase iron-sulfur subunit
MFTQPGGALANTARGREARALLERCVHCGFCLEACPTYRVLGDERDGPRGRIYLMKQMIEGGPAGATRQHLDRCLTCRACEPACPSGMQYGRLLEIGREIVEESGARPVTERLARRLLIRMVSARWLFGSLLALSRRLRPALPRRLAAMVPPKSAPGAWPPARHARRMAVLDGCVQPVLAPGINAAAARVLDRMGISLVRVRGAGCCGALAHHLGDVEGALEAAHRTLIACQAALDAGCEAIVSTASGCGLMVKDYAHLLRSRPGLAATAQRVAAATRDLSEVLEPLSLARLPSDGLRRLTVAFHSPCTLQHGQGLTGQVESLLEATGHGLTPVTDGGLCCGSAGSHAILQPALAQELRARKLKALLEGAPRAIATANVGCLAHLGAASSVPVRHWIELVDAALDAPAAGWPVSSGRT